MSENQQRLDYLAPDIAEMTAFRSSVAPGAPSASSGPYDEMTRMVARHLLTACVAVPAGLWCVLILGVWLQLYGLGTCFTLFVFLVAAGFGSIVWMSLKKLSRTDEQRARVEEQLKAAKESAEAANRFRSAFFANISHEIRTPLTAINGFAELLLNPQRTDEERLSDARVIRRNGEHLLTLINDILDLSKIEAGKMSVERLACCPAAIVGEVSSMLRQRASEKGLSLGVSFDGPVPTTIRTDPTRLRQILINLVANAIKFTKEGGVSLTVAIKPSAHAPKPLLEVKVTDTGIGIPAEQQASLFQPFVQGDATIARHYGGTGLGLSISRHFAVALDGDVTVSSTAGQGSTFTVTVGTGPLIGVDIQKNPESLLLAQEKTFAETRVRISGSVLVAEDGIDNQALIAAKLREAGLMLEFAPNGQIAYEKALAALQNDKPFDLILMDVQMPVMDGFTATQQLRSKGYRGPIIALTANAMDRDRSKCLNAGCNDFVTKPIQMDALFKAMGRYLKVEKVAPEPAMKEDPAIAEARRVAKTQKFNDELSASLEQINEAIEREDRVQLKEIAQLVLGKAVAADLKDVAVLASKLFQTAAVEQSWPAIREVAAEFARDSKSDSDRQAA
jgi:signal transduction histidine kinase/CheY-like chemotaxis protein